jgi:hypothetical protein
VFDPVSDSPEFHDLDSRTHGRTDALPVHYVFPQMTLDIDAAVEALIGASSEELEPRGEGEDRVEAKKGVIVVWDVAFDWLAGKSYRRVLCGHTHCRNHPIDICDQGCAAYFIRCDSTTNHLQHQGYGKKQG